MVPHPPRGGNLSVPGVEQNFRCDPGLTVCGYAQMNDGAVRWRTQGRQPGCG